MSIPDLPTAAGRRDAFTREAKPLTIPLPDGATLTAKPSERNDLTLGWHGQTTFLVLVGGQYVPATATVTVTLKGSKRWPVNETPIEKGSS